MSEKLSEVYEAYDMEVYQTMRGRGAVILKTDNGIRQLRQLDANESRLAAEYQFKEKLYEMGFCSIDRCIKNRQEELVTYDRYNNPYVMRTFFDGRECNVTNKDEIKLAVDNLAKLHLACREVFNSTEGDVHIRLNDDFRKRNLELKRVRNFIGRQSPKREFEEIYVTAYDFFYKQAIDCEREYGSSGHKGAARHLGYCHGMYNHHSVMLYQAENGRTMTGTINFDRFYVGNQLADLYHFLRKTVEKNGYSFEVMQSIIEQYSDICPLNKQDIEYIYILYRYPEKFYKISNQYMNAPKNWISPKMLEKLNRVIQDEEKKKRLLEQLDSYKSKLKSI